MIRNHATHTTFLLNEVIKKVFIMQMQFFSFQLDFETNNPINIILRKHLC